VPDTMKMTDITPLGGSLLPSCHSSRVFRCDLLMWMNAYWYIWLTTTRFIHINM